MTGAYVYTPEIWPPLAAAAFLAGLALYCWRRRSVPAARPLAANCLLAALALLTMAPEAAAVAPATKIAWYKMQVVWYLPVATAMTCFVLDYAYPGRWLTRRTLVLLALPPLLAVLLIVAAESQGMWRGLEVAADDAVVPYLAPGGIVVVAYGLGLALVNMAALLWLFIRSPQHRWPAALILVGGIVARGLFLMEFTRSSWTLALDPLFVALVLPWTLYAIALFGFHILDPLPAARTMAIEQMQEGMIILDAAGRVESLNPAAAAMLSIPAASARGKAIAELLPSFPALHTGSTDAGKPAAPPSPLKETPAGHEVQLGVGPDARLCELELSSLEDSRGLPLGHLVMLLDVTAERRAQAQALEQQQTLAVLHERERLARELHDTLGQVLAFVNSQGQAVRRLLARGDVAAADEHVARLVEVAAEADTDLRESILSLRVALGKQGLWPALAAYLDQYERRYGIHTKLQWPPTLGDRAFEPLVEVQLLRIVQEALANARKHAHAHAVCVAFGAQDGWAQVMVQDDGCGFDLREVAGDAAGRVGLRVMQERAEEIGGALAVQSAPGAGTQITVTAPLAHGPGNPANMKADRHARAVG
jgi:signal transduction histidine kinase